MSCSVTPDAETPVLPSPTFPLDETPPQPSPFGTAAPTGSPVSPLSGLAQASSRELPRINAPYFSGPVPFPEAAIFWFGQVDDTRNYTDVRVGYNDQELFIHLAILDRYLWYNPQGLEGDLPTWDSASLYINPGESTGSLSSQAVRLEGELSRTEDRAGYQAAAHGSAVGWEPAALPFQTQVTWRGNEPNNNSGSDRGWTLNVHLPFASLGLAGPPPKGTMWRLGLAVHDRDDAAGTPVLDQLWPLQMNPDQPATWGQLRFGLPQNTSPSAAMQQTVTLRSGLNGLQVADGAVGGGTNCGKDSIQAFFSLWGNAKAPQSPDAPFANVQNQYDVADWPCFSKFYLAFPLDSLPPGKVILSARLVLHQFGNSGGDGWGTPPASLIQVSTLASGWQPGSLSWNQAPLAQENVSQAWVEPLPGFPGWPGVPRTWDVTRAVEQAYAAGRPLGLVLYSADGAYHSGKYFVTSSAPSWNQEARPALEIGLGAAP